jgi:hypothetical protein
MLKVGKTVGETALSLLKLQMNGDISLIPPSHPIVGEVLHIVQGNRNPI